MEFQLSFRPRITCRRDADHPPCLLTARAAELKVRAAEGRSTLCESYTGDTLVKPFFDYDEHGEVETDARRVFLEICAPPIQQVLNVDTDRLAAATRSGWLPDGRYKTSIRVFVQGLSLRATEMNDLLAHEAFSDPGWDKGIYPAPGKERLLAVVGGVKGPEDPRRLDSLGEPREYSDYLIQGLSGLEQSVEVEPAQRAKRGRAQRADDREAPACEGKDALLPLAEADMIRVAEEALRAPPRRCRGFVAHRVRGNSVQFVCEGDRKCVHGEFHKGNGCFVNFLPDGGMLYHCTSVRCADYGDLRIGEWEPDPSVVDLDALPIEKRMQLDPAVLNGLSRLAADWGDRAAAFQTHKIEYMNRFLALMKHPAGVEIVEEYLHEDGSVREYARRKPADMTHILDNAPGCLHMWKTDERRRCYDAYGFWVDPADEDPKKYNLFKGKFPLAHLEPPYDLDEQELDRIRPILDHYHECFCESDPVLSGYLWDWLAFPLQRRGAKTEVAVVVTGQIFRAIAGMGNLLQETQIKLRRDITMLKLRYYTTLRKLQADSDREQWSRYKYEMRKEELAALETDIARMQRVLG